MTNEELDREIKINNEIMVRYHNHVKNIRENDYKNYKYFSTDFNIYDDRCYKFIVWTILSIRDEVYAEFEKSDSL